MNTGEMFLRAFRAKRAQEAQGEAAIAADTNAKLSGLSEHPGWLYLVDHLTQGREVLYRRMEEGTATDRDRVLAKLFRQLCEGPTAILEAARTVLKDAANVQ